MHSPDTKATLLPSPSAQSFMSRETKCGASLTTSSTHFAVPDIVPERRVQIAIDSSVVIVF